MGPLSAISILPAFILLCCSIALSHQYSPPADADPTVNVGSLFQLTTSRNQKVITQAVDFVLSMQTAPTCTRMAALHLMNECKLLEHAPEFAKSRPEAYLDNVKTEYAAKLAVCELLSAQVSNPVPPPHCDILVPSLKACGKSGGWWYSKPEASTDKQCYPAFKDYQYIQCLKSLQSTPQFWTSFSNARQNAVVMCQASRDAIERENHLETFKNLTQILGVVTSTMQKTTEDYESLIREQRRFSEETRASHHNLKEDVHAVQEKAVATVRALDERFQDFMETSISQLIMALADSQSAEIARIHQSMQHFLQNLITESSQLANSFASEIQRFHQISLVALKSQYEAQMDGYNRLSNHMDDLYLVVNRTNDIADISLAKADSVAQRLNTLESQTEYIVEGFAFLGGISTFVSLFIYRSVLAMGAVFTFTVLYKINPTLATYATGACSSVLFLYSCGILEWLRKFSTRNSNTFMEKNPSGFPAELSPFQQGTIILLLLWVCSYPIYYTNKYLGHMIISAFDRLFRPLWISTYVNEAGSGLLPSVEIPITRSCDMSYSSASPGSNLIDSSGFETYSPKSDGKWLLVGS